MQEKGSTKRKLLPWAFVCAALMIAFIALAFLWNAHRQVVVYTEDAFIDGFRVDLSPDILGRVIELKVDEGDFVREGDIVAILEQDILLAEKTEAEAALVSAEEKIAFEKAQFEKLRNDYERALEGIKDQIISPQKFDHMQKDYEMGEASYKKALADRELALSKVDVIKAHLYHTYIFASCNGVIAKRWIYVGDVIRPGQAVFTLYDIENVWVQANLSETKIEKVSLGDRVEINVDAYPDKKFIGQVFTIKAAAASQFSVIPQNNATGNYTKVAQRIPVKLTLENSFINSETPLYLFPGMNVEVKIQVKK